MVFNLATCAAEGADALCHFEGPGTAFELERFRDEGSGRTGGNAVSAEIAIERLAVDSVDNGRLSLVHHGYRITADDLVIDLHALFAKDAAVRVAFQKSPVVADGTALQDGRVLLPGDFKSVAAVLQVAFAASIAYRAVERMIHEHKLHDLLARLGKVLRLGGDNDPFFDRRVACGHIAVNPCHFHRTDPAGAGRRDLLQPAEGRYGYAELPGSFKNGCPGGNADIFTVNCQTDHICDSSDFQSVLLFDILIRAAKNLLSLQRLCFGIVCNCSVVGTD